MHLQIVHTCKNKCPFHWLLQRQKFISMVTKDKTKTAYQSAFVFTKNDFGWTD